VPRFLPDTSVMVAAVCAWHEHHARAADEIERRLERGQELIAAGPALVEVYAVLTRLRAPHWLAPADAHALLEANFLGGEVATLDWVAVSTRRLGNGSQPRMSCSSTSERDQPRRGAS
jgi:predicted nucleic acid-binding protein